MVPLFAEKLLFTQYLKPSFRLVNWLTCAYAEDFSSSEQQTAGVAFQVMIEIQDEIGILHKKDVL